MATTRSARLARKARPMLALAAAGLVLAGCAARPGTAATVDGHRITDADVAAATTEYQEFSGQEVEASVVLNTLIQAEVMQPLAKENGFGVSHAEVEEFLTQQAVMLGNAELPESSSPAFLDLGRFLLQLNEIQADADGEEILTEFGQRLGTAEISASPRYGTVSDDGVVQPTTPDWIVQPDQAGTSGDTVR